MEDSVTELMDFEDRVVEEEKHSSLVNVSEGPKTAPLKTVVASLNTTTEAKRQRKPMMGSYLNHKNNKMDSRVYGTPSIVHNA